MKRLRNLLLLIVFAQLNLFAQENTNDKKWEFLIEPYLMISSMNGESGIRELPPLDVDVSASDIFSNLEFGSMLYLEARTDKWVIGSDLVFTRLGQDVNPTTVVNSGKIEVSQLIWEVSGLYRITFLEAGIGMRLNSITMDADIRRNVIGGGTTDLINADNSEFWVDPVIIARLSETFKDKWQLQLRTDIGGFGIGSDITWLVQGSVGYRFSKLFQTTIGYRFFGMDYETGSGIENFKYDITTSGPLIKLGFNI